MKKILYLLTLLFPLGAAAQQLPVHSQFFLNPYILNPSYVGLNGQTQLFLSHRQHMQRTADAPVTTTINLQIPTRGRAAFGLGMVDHVNGLLANTSALASFGYAFQLGDDHYLRIGGSGGLGKYTVDRNRLENEDDWTRVKSFNNKTFLDANVGISYQLKGLSLGVSAPTLLNKKMVNTNVVDPLDFRRISYYVANAGYRLKLSEAFALSPQAQYRYSTEFPSEYQAIGTLHFRNVWAGGGYRQHTGPVASAGAKIKNTFTIGYAYEPAPAQSTATQGTHEILMSLSFGQIKTRKEQVSEAKEARNKVEEKKSDHKAKEKAKKEKAFEKKQAARKAAADKAEAKSEKEKAKKEKAREVRNEKAKAEKAKNEKAKLKKVEAKKAKAEKEKAQKARKADKKQASRKPAKPLAPAKKEPAAAVQPPVMEQEVQPAPAPAPAAPAKVEERIEEHHREHPLELKKGSYVVVGSFNIFDNAVRFNNTIYKRGLRSDYRYSSKTMRYYVFVHQSGDLAEARAECDRIRQLVGISDAWVLIVE